MKGLRQALEPDKQPTVRFACRLVLGDTLDGIEARIPDESRDLQVR